MKSATSKFVLAATLLAGVSSLATGSPSLAAGREAAGKGASRSVAVRYGDLDLTRPAGIEVLYDRLRSAARRVCGTADNRDVRDSLAVRQCYRDSLDRAVAQVDRAELSARHQGSGRHIVAALPGSTGPR